MPQAIDHEGGNGYQLPDFLCIAKYTHMNICNQLINPFIQKSGNFLIKVKAFPTANP